ncbi:MAG: type I 3-dehydroquinate dehydratase [Ruminococcaceae bacterium]|nr:type I 3-dehydroquinate dehydratase [Oscillospiraceae bacterium]
MKKSFLNNSNSLLTVMLQCKTPEAAISKIRNANCLGADAYGLQVETLMPEFQNPDTFKRLFTEMRNKPCYVTNYRYAYNQKLTDDELADGIITLAESGATLCDVMGDIFCKHPEELTDNDEAIQKQMKLIEKLHSMGAEVLMSSHLYKFAPAERVLEIAFEQKRRGADIIKIVTAADNMEQQIENLRITNLLKQELGAPFLFLSGGVSTIHRRLGGHLGNCMTLCVYDHDALSTASQPLLSTMKTIRDSIDF